MSEMLFQKINPKEVLNKYYFSSDERNDWFGWDEYRENVEEFEQEKWKDYQIEEHDILDADRQISINTEDKKTEESTISQETGQEELEELIDIKIIKDEDDVSEETIITPQKSMVEVDALSASSILDICLKEVEISDSQLKIANLFNIYPIPEDPGILQAFRNIEEVTPVYRNDGVLKFNDLARKMKLSPIKALTEMFQTDEINLKYYGANPRIIQAMCKALLNNTSVQSIDLTDNWLTEETCSHLNNLLLNNDIISHLNLSGCRIGLKGARYFQTGLQKAISLVNLDLSACDLDDTTLSYIDEGLNNHQKLEFLNLAKNNLDDASSNYLCHLISNCENLKELNLSWNSLYSENVWKNLVKALTKSIVKLNLSWNALGEECIPYMTQLFQSNKLEHLNLSGNRFHSTDIDMIANAVLKNKILISLYLGNNPMQAKDAETIITPFTSEKTAANPLQLLDLENIWAPKTILPLLEIISSIKPYLKINLGGILSNYKIIGPNIRKILLDRANFEATKSKKQGYIGDFLLSLEDGFISKEDFMQLIKKSKLKFSETLVEELVNAFAGPGNTVDQTTLKSFYINKYIYQLI